MLKNAGGLGAFGEAVKERGVAFGPKGLVRALATVGVLESAG